MPKNKTSKGSRGVGKPEKENTFKFQLPGLTNKLSSTKNKKLVLHTKISKSDRDGGGWRKAGVEAEKMNVEQGEEEAGSHQVVDGKPVEVDGDWGCRRVAGVEAEELEIELTGEEAEAGSQQVAGGKPAEADGDGGCTWVAGVEAGEVEVEQVSPPGEDVEAGSQQVAGGKPVEADGEGGDREVAGVKAGEVEANQRSDAGSKQVAYPCPVCNKSFKNLGAMTKHRVKHDKQPSVISCPFPSCDFKGANQKAVSNHYQYRHRKKKSPSPRVICAVCDLDFASLKSLNVHKVSNHVEKQCRVPSCGDVFGSGKLERLHFRSKHSWDGRKMRSLTLQPPYCQLCNKKFQTKSGFEKHLKAHQLKSSIPDTSSCKQKTVPLECDICEKKFTSRDGLRKHKKKHSGAIATVEQVLTETQQQEAQQPHVQLTVPGLGVQAFDVNDPVLLAYLEENNMEVK